MNQWAFVWASYAIVLLGSAATLIWSYRTMKSAEHKANSLESRR